MTLWRLLILIYLGAKYIFSIDLLIFHDISCQLEGFMQFPGLHFYKAALRII